MLKYLSLSVLWNFFITNLSLFLSRLTRRLVFLGNPFALSIEPSSVCNLSCPECPVGSGSFASRKSFMDNDLFEKIIHELPSSVAFMNLYFQGEPFMDPGLIEKIRMAKRRKIFIEISTNGHFLNEIMCQNIIAASPDRIIVSVDGADAEAYKKYRINGDFDKVISGIKLLVQQRNKKGQKRPKIVLQMLVFKHNENQIAQFRSLCRMLGADRVQLKSVQFYNQHMVAEMQSTKKSFARYIVKGKSVTQKRKVPRCCSRLWMHPVITTEGFVLPCCYDKSGSLPMGNINEHSLNEIWTSPAYMKLRREMISKNYPPICDNCGG